MLTSGINPGLQNNQIISNSLEQLVTTQATDQPQEQELIQPQDSLVKGDPQQIEDKKSIFSKLKDLFTANKEARTSGREDMGGVIYAPGCTPREDLGGILSGGVIYAPGCSPNSNDPSCEPYTKPERPPNPLKTSEP